MPKRAAENKKVDGEPAPKKICSWDNMLYFVCNNAHANWRRMLKKKKEEQERKAVEEALAGNNYF